MIATPSGAGAGSGRRLLFACFVVSGFCGLLYQIVWLRMAFARFGVITPVLSVVVSAFMLGLSLGSWAAGRYGRTLSERTRLGPLALYALAELLTGVGAFAVPTLFDAGSHALLRMGDMASGAYLGLSAVVLTLSMLPWCFCMGTTYPLVADHLVQREGDDASFSYLYLANVLGATAGVVITALLLIEVYGFSRTLTLAGLSNFAVAATAFALSRRVGPTHAAVSVAVAAPNAVRSAAETTPALAYGLLFTTGFASMAMEVVWTRAFTAFLSTTVYAFAALLCAYLMATWVGTTLYRKWRARERTIGNTSLLLFGSAASLLPLVAIDPRLHLSPLSVVLSIVPLCAMLGVLTPKLVDELSVQDPLSVGRAYGVNMVGSILGPLVAGYVLLATLPIKWCLLVLTLPLLGYAAYAAARSSRRAAQLGVLAIITAAALGITSQVRSFEDPRFFAEHELRRDHTATVIAAGRGPRRSLLVNGINMTYLTPITKLMAHLPMAHHQGPAHKALVICLGMGATLRSLASWGSDVTTVELSAGVRDSFAYFFSDAAALLRRPGISIVVDDGRRFLQRNPTKYDIVAIDPPPPVPAAGSSLLYSVEFYALLKQRMAPGAILQQWFPSNDPFLAPAVARSLTRQFRYVRAFRSLEDVGVHFLASQSPIARIDAPTFLQRMPAAAQDDLAEQIKREALPRALAAQLAREVSVERLTQGDGDSFISDDRPLNEYYLLRDALK